MAALATANLPATPLLFHAFYLPLVLGFTSRQVKLSKDLVYLQETPLLRSGWQALLCVL